MVLFQSLLLVRPRIVEGGHIFHAPHSSDLSRFFGKYKFTDKGNGANSQSEYAQYFGQTLFFWLIKAQFVGNIDTKNNRIKNTHVYTEFIDFMAIFNKKRSCYYKNYEFEFE